MEKLENCKLHNLWEYQERSKQVFPALQTVDKNPRTHNVTHKITGTEGRSAYCFPRNKRPFPQRNVPQSDSRVIRLLCLTMTVVHDSDLVTHSLAEVIVLLSYTRRCPLKQTTCSSMWVITEQIKMQHVNNYR